MSNSLLTKPTALVFLLLSLIGRLIPHPANFTPLGGTALFGGAKLERPWNYLAPLFILFITDLIIGFHGTMAYIYISFVISVWLGEKLLKHNPNFKRVAVVSIAGSVLFFLISNFGVWAEGILYPKTLEGLMRCYFLALPFFKNTLAGDLLFGVGFFAAYQWAEQKQYIPGIDRKLTSWLGN